MYVISNKLKLKSFDSVIDFEYTLRTRKSIV